MGNLLSRALLAGAIMAIVDLAIGMSPISWPVFMAALVAILMSLDSGGSRVSEGSPACNSLGCGLAIMYLAAILGYLAWSFMGIGKVLALALSLAVASGVSGHLLTAALSGSTVFTLPRNLEPMSWPVRCGASSDCFWPAWGRFRIKKALLKDSHLNGVSLALLMFAIWLGGPV